MKRAQNFVKLNNFRKAGFKIFQPVRCKFLVYQLILLAVLGLKQSYSILNQSFSHTEPYGDEPTERVTKFLDGLGGYVDVVDVYIVFGILSGAILLATVVCLLIYCHWHRNHVKKPGSVYFYRSNLILIIYTGIIFASVNSAFRIIKI